ncbi:MAG TPA: CdaR family protein [Armatimonadota bacterium]|jgi:YbbR domain-containing protein
MLATLRHNWPFKLLALGFSIMLWYNVKMHQEPWSMSIPVHLDLRGVPADMVAASSVAQVNVVINGPKVYTTRVTPEQLTAYVDLRDAVPGSRRVDVKVLVPSRLGAITVVSRTPEKVDIQLRRKVRRNVPVSVEWTGQPTAGARYGAVHLDPSTVEVVGADNVVESVDRAVVRLRAGDPHITGRFPLSSVDQRGAIVGEVTLSPDSATVDAALTQTMSRRQAFVSPAFNGLPADGYAIERVWTEPQVVTLVGTPDDMKGIDSIPTRPISVQGASGPLARVVALVPPRGVTALPDRVTVRVRVRRGP